MNIPEYTVVMVTAWAFDFTATAFGTADSSMAIDIAVSSVDTVTAWALVDNSERLINYNSYLFTYSHYYFFFFSLFPSLHLIIKIFIIQTKRLVSKLFR